MPVIIPKIWQTASCHTIADMLQTSVLAPHLAPRMTSGERYWRVWISFVKWCPTQQAFPRSAILTDMVSIALARSSWLVSFGEADLLREIPDMVWERFSLDILSGLYGRKSVHLRGLFLVFLVVVGVIRRSRICKTKHLSHRFGRCSGSYSAAHYNASLGSG